MTPNAVMVRYAEVFLKGGNRPFFLARLREALDRQVRDAGPYRVRETHGQLFVIHKETRGWDLPDLPGLETVGAAVERTFGVASWSPVRVVPRELSHLEIAAAAIGDEHVAGAASFKVESRRADKSFPLNSIELNQRLGGVIWERTKTRVDVNQPAVTVSCHILPQAAALFVEIRRGPGGLPVGSGGRAMLLLSGGIDSPVAGWLAMRRGCDLDAVHFDAAPYTTPEARAKVEELARQLSAWSRGLRLHVVPFGAIQGDLRDGAPGRLLVVLYRRMMMRIACRLAVRRKALALVTGENLGQVASQTLENLSVIDAAATMPVLRPLVTFDKVETIALAQRIGTFETSILPYDDCCALFVPGHPETKARPQVVAEAEAGFDVDALADQAVAATEILEFPGPGQGDRGRTPTSKS